MKHCLWRFRLDSFLIMKLHPWKCRLDNFVIMKLHPWFELDNFLRMTISSLEVPTGHFSKSFTLWAPAKTFLSHVCYCIAVLTSWNTCQLIGFIGGYRTVCVTAHSCTSTHDTNIAVQIRNGIGRNCICNISRFEKGQLKNDEVLWDFFLLIIFFFCSNAWEVSTEYLKEQMITHFSFIPVCDQASDVDVVSRGCIPVTSQGGCHGEGEVSRAPPQCDQPPVRCGWYAHPWCCGKWQPLQQLWQREFWHHYLQNSAALWLTCLVRRDRFPVSK